MSGSVDDDDDGVSARGFCTDAAPQLTVVIIFLPSSATHLRLLIGPRWSLYSDTKSVPERE